MEFHFGNSFCEATQAFEYNDVDVESPRREVAREVVDQPLHATVVQAGEHMSDPDAIGRHSPQWVRLKASKAPSSCNFEAQVD